MKRILPMLSAIGLRYSAIIIQFALVILISRRTSTDVAGGYFIIFGWINSTYFLAGLGLPDGMVREVSHHLGTGARARVYPLAVRCGLVCAGLTLATALVGAAGGLAFFPRDLVLLTAIWWLCYATVFFCAQAQLALGWPTAGSFFFYPALNVSLLFTLFPFLLTAHKPPLTRLLGVAITGAVPMAVVAIAMTWAAMRPYRAGADTAAREPLGHVMGLGIRIAVARVAQTTIYWLPTWFAGFALAPAAAAILGLASRLNNAINAVMAAIRFIIRPQIVAAAAHDDWPAITRSARTINTLTAGGVLIAILAYLAVGKFLIVGIFGASYAAAYLPLAVLLLGTLAEATGGVVDEVLKMTGNATFVLIALCCVVAVEALLCWVLAPYGMIWLAVAQAGTLAALYTVHLSFAWHRRGVLLLPMLRPHEIVATLRQPRRPAAAA